MEQQRPPEAKPAEPESKASKVGEVLAKLANLGLTLFRSVSIAMFMAVVAMLGAVTAYRAALAEQETLKYERRLQQGQMLELVYRQELLSKVSSSTRYENSARLHTPAPEGDEEQAGKSTPATRSEAALRKLQAEEEAAHVRSLQPYIRYFDVYIPKGYDLEAAIAMHTSYWLRDRGFDTQWQAPADGKFPSIWAKLEGDVRGAETKVLHLAAAVVVFVLALAFLTFAQLNHAKPKAEKILSRIGGVLAAAALAFAILTEYNDPSSWIDFAAFTVAFLILGEIGKRLARRLHFEAKAEEGELPAVKARAAHASAGDSRKEIQEEEEEPVHPAEVDPALFPGMRLHFAPVGHKFGRFVIAMIALCAVLSAFSGYFYSRASVDSSKAISDALENQADLFRLNSRRVTVWNRIVGKVATAEDYHLRYEAARQRRELAKEEPNLLSQKDAADQVELRRTMLESFEKKEPRAHQTMTGPLGPEQDVNFPEKLVISRSYHAPAKATAEWSANNEQALGYQKRATTYLALLTFFAIALYLLGQALGMGHSRDAFILVGFACSLVVAGVGYGLFIHFVDKVLVLRTPKSAGCVPPDLNNHKLNNTQLLELASEHFAQGMVLYDSSPDDPANARDAADKFQCAVEIHPSFPAGNFYFALAANRASTPQLNEGGFFSLMDKKALGRVSGAEKQAIDLLRQQSFAPPDYLITSNGFDTYADGLVKRDRNEIEAARRITVKAIAVSRKDDLVPRFNLGVVQFAEGDDSAALKTYEATLALGNPGKDPFVTNDGAMIGGAVTDLEVFGQYCGGLNQADYCTRFQNKELPRLKSELVAGTWPFAKGRTLASSGIKLTNLHLEGSAAGLGWYGDAESPIPNPAGKAQDKVVVLWYAYSPEWGAWRVLPAISGTLTPAYYAPGHHDIFYSVLHASHARSCVQSGKYRAEFYVDGELASTEEISLANENLLPQMFPDLDVAVCRPPSWQRWKPSDPDAVWTRGFIDDGKNRGVFVFSFFDPHPEEREASQERALQRAGNILNKEGLMPGPVAGRRIYDCSTLGGYSNEVMAAFSSGASNSVAKSWTTAEGLVNVAVVLNNEPAAKAQGPSREDCEILFSAETVPAQAAPPLD